MSKPSRRGLQRKWQAGWAVKDSASGFRRKDWWGEGKHGRKGGHHVGWKIGGKDTDDCRSRSQKRRGSWKGFKAGGRVSGKEKWDPEKKIPSVAFRRFLVVKGISRRGVWIRTLS